MLRVYVLLPIFFVLTQRSWVVFRNLTDCLLLSDLPRSWVKIKSKTECVSAQRINHALWYISSVKPDTWLLSKRTYHSNHLNQTNHSSFCVVYCICNNNRLRGCSAFKLLEKYCKTKMISIKIKLQFSTPQFSRITTK